MTTTELNPKQYIQILSEEFAKLKDETAAGYMEKYLKNKFRFFGLKSTPRKEVSRSFMQEYGIPGLDSWQDYVRKMWDCEQREFQYFAQELCLKYKKSWQLEDLKLFEFMVTHKSWWDTVDYIASNLLGNYFWKFPDRIKPTINDWKTSDNMWLVRTALIFQLKYKEHTDFKLLQDVIHLHKYSNEFFIQKAIGWALRQYARVSAEDVQAFVTETELKPLSRREALKHIT